ncbi:transmembrane protein 71 [Halichoerus grypus]
MYRISQLMSTPVASSSGSERRHTGEPSPTCVFPSEKMKPRLRVTFLGRQKTFLLPSLVLPKDFLDGDTSFECCSVDLLTASHFACRRSPRLLSNGYYTWTEDSFLCDKDGNITLSPPQTSVLYKENLVRIFRKKKKIRRSFSNLFNLGASKSWLHGNIFGDVDSSLSEDTWLEGVRRLDMYHCNEIETSLWREVSFPAILLAVCFIICACARWFLGGILASVFTCSLMITIAYAVKSLFPGLASCVKSTTYAQCQGCHAKALRFQSLKRYVKGKVKSHLVWFAKI